MTSSIALVYRRDFRDDIFNPQSGHYIEVLGQTAGGPVLRGDNSFNRLLTQAVKVFRFGDAVIAMRFEAGWLRAYHTSAEISGPDFGVPIEERYFAGGGNTVRGYQESSLGPCLTEEDATLVQDPQFLTERLSGGGSALLLANIEMRFLIIPEWNIGAEVFLDSGNVWTNWRQIIGTPDWWCLATCSAGSPTGMKSFPVSSTLPWRECSWRWRIRSPAISGFPSGCTAAGSSGAAPTGH